MERQHLLLLFLPLLFVANCDEEQIDIAPWSSMPDLEQKSSEDRVLSKEAFQLTNERKKKFAINGKFDALRDEFLSKGWEQAPKPTSVLWNFKWANGYHELKVSEHSRHQVVNHFKNFIEMGSKTLFAKNLYRLQKERGETLNIWDFYPRAYIISELDDNTQEINRFKSDFLRGSGNVAAELGGDETLVAHAGNSSEQPWPQQSFDGTGNIWIVKPGANARGVGIQTFDNLTAILDYVNDTMNIHRGFVVQKYIENPLLIRNKKFDIRQFVMVTSLNPLIVFFREDAYLRFSSKNYDVSNLQDRFVHLTNHQVQKDSDEYQTAGIPFLQWSLQTFEDYLRDELGKPDFWENQLQPKIEQIVIAAAQTWPKDGHRNLSFELLGFDIMLDDKLNPYLIEVNTNPGLHMLTDIVIPHHTGIIQDMLKVTVDNRKDWEDSDECPMVNDEKFGRWKLIYREPRGTPSPSS